MQKPILLLACILLSSCGGSNSASSNRDTDFDGIPDNKDNCQIIANPNQDNLDGDRYGDACDDDRDGDGVFDEEDDFPDNAVQYLDLDSDGIGHTEDDDNDGDGINDDIDNCPYVANAEQADSNGLNDGVDLGDACELSGLNDSGQDRSGAFPRGNYESCEGDSNKNLSDLQDCNYGRDYLARKNVLTANLAKAGAGDSGFDFTKLDSSGQILADQNDVLNIFYCIKDNVTGLIWESKKSGDASLINRKDDLFYWFDERAEWNAGVVGTKDAGPVGNGLYPDTGRHCAGFVEDDETTWCNTQAFVNRMNALNDGQGYCGFNDWRLPSLEELNSLVDYGAPSSTVSGKQLAIDETYFRFTQGRNYWTRTNNARLPAKAWTINFAFGANYIESKNSAWYVRLVSDGAEK
jgi:hypothetical protein